MKKNALLGLLMVIAFLLAACGSPKIEGKWESVYAEMDGTYEYKVGAISIEFKEDKTAIATSEFSTLEGSWGKEGDKYIITFENDPGSAVFKGDLLAITTPDESVYYFSRDAKAFKNFPEGTTGVPKE